MLFDAVPARSFSRISSRQNPHVAQYRAAAQGELTGKLLLDGPHLVRDALAAGISLEHAAVVSTALDREEINALMAELEHIGVETVVATPQVMAAMSPVRSASAIVALGRRPAPDAARLYAGSAPLAIIASDVQDPGNLGAIVRAAEAGSATSVIAAGACADPFGWKALRGSSGSSLRLPIGVARDAAAAIAESRRHGCHVIALVPRGGQSLYELDLTRATAMLIGGEGPGLDRALIEQADERVTIPMHAPVESLNAAVAAAIVVYEALRQRT
jgi:TrmH family RNA methyltransferase